MKIGIVVPHIFMQRDILSSVIFSPASLAIQLAEGLQKQGATVTLFTPGPVDTSVQNITADRRYFEAELLARGDNYMDLLNKHPFTFITLARQLQGELIATAYKLANQSQLDVIHIYTNEEEIALPFAELCTKPVVFTHHDPFNFMVKYKSFFPKYKQNNWISMSLAQRSGMPNDTKWLANIYHGLSAPLLTPVTKPIGGYIAYIGRIIQPKGVHLAIAAIQHYNKSHQQSPLQLKIAGKHYAAHKKDAYWQTHILPYLDDTNIEYVGYISTDEAKREFMANADGVIVPSLFAEPFGMVSIEALACGTPVIGLNSGALPEVINNQKTGYIVRKQYAASNELDETATAVAIAEAITKLPVIDRAACRSDYEARFTAERMCAEHLDAYQELIR